MDSGALDVLNHPEADFKVECGNARCRVMKDGSQVGYGSGNVGYLYLNHKKLNSNPGPKAKLSVSFN